MPHGLTSWLWAAGMPFVRRARVVPARHKWSFSRQSASVRRRLAQWRAPWRVSQTSIGELRQSSDRPAQRICRGGGWQFGLLAGLIERRISIVGPPPGKICCACSDKQYDRILPVLMTSRGSPASLPTWCRHDQRKEIGSDRYSGEWPSTQRLRCTRRFMQGPAGARAQGGCAASRRYAGTKLKRQSNEWVGGYHQRRQPRPRGQRWRRTAIRER